MCTCEYEFCNDILVRFPLSLFQYFLARPFLLDPFFIHESFLGFLFVPFFPSRTVYNVVCDIAIVILILLGKVDLTTRLY